MILMVESYCFQILGYSGGLIFGSVRPKPNIRPKVSARSAKYSAPKLSANLPNIRLTIILGKWGTKTMFLNVVIGNLSIINLIFFQFDIKCLKFILKYIQNLLQNLELHSVNLL